MKRLDLITGFLGSGKTTFILEYAAHWIAKGERVAVIVNDHGAINVDRMLLEAKLPECHIEMVIGGDVDCHRRRLKTKLITMGMEGYTRVIIEPSGVFDVEEFLNLIYEEPLDRMYRIGNLLTLVDGSMEREVSKETRYLLASQISDAGMVVVRSLSGEKEALLHYLNGVLAEFKSSRRLQDLYLWERGGITEADFACLDACGYVASDMVKLPVVEGDHYQTRFYFHVKIGVARLEETLQDLFTHGKYGHVLRVKGYLLTDEGWLEVNATPDRMQIAPADVGQEVFLVIGEALKDEEIAGCWDSYRNE